MSSNEADGSPQDNGIENATDEGTNEVTEEASAKEVEEQNEKESKEEQNVEESKEEQKEEEQKPSETQIDQFEADDLFGGEDDEEEEEEGEEIEYGPPEVIETVDLPRSSVAMKHYVRLSNIIGIESKPFDRNTYKEPNRSDGSIAPEAVMRWREIMDENGNLKRESNARIVTWSDRSLQLFIGNEVFDVSMQLNQDGTNYLYVRDTGFIKSQGAIQSKLSFNPATLKSKTHQKLASSIVARHKKERKVKMVLTVRDPEKEREDAEKDEESKLKEKKKKQKKVSQLELNPEHLEMGVSDEEEEIRDEEDDIEEGNLGAIKAKYGKKKSSKKRHRDDEDEHQLKSRSRR